MGRKSRTGKSKRKRKKKHTPAMRQFFAMKERYPDAVIFFRMGDFYETFFEDAKITAQELDIVLTSRGTTPDGEKIPLAGIPYHALDNHLTKMVKSGHKVAICEQVEDPKTAKGVVKRDVVRVVTPGTVTDEGMLEDGANNFLMALVRDTDGDGNSDTITNTNTDSDASTGTETAYGVAFVDVSTGDFFATRLAGADVEHQLVSEVTRFKPAECILEPDLAANERLVKMLENQNGVYVQPYRADAFAYEPALARLREQLGTGPADSQAPGSFERTLAPLALRAAGAAVEYLHATQLAALDHINRLLPIQLHEHMVLDSTTLTNLEIMRNIRDGTARGTLLGVLNKTKTAMGARLLKKWLLRPLCDLPRIEQRQDAVEEGAGNLFVREDVRELLKEVADIERLLSRIVLERANARDLVALKHSLEKLPELKRMLRELKPRSKLLKALRRDLDPNKAVIKLIAAAIKPEPAVGLNNGGIIADGYNETLDQYRAAMGSGKQWVRDLEAQERAATGIKSLKVGFNKVFGYYLEVTKPNLDSVPDSYVRKQTLANSERFITPELKEKEALILSAEEKSQALEYELFIAVRKRVAEHAKPIQATAHALATLDVIFALAEVAVRNAYCKPTMNLGDAVYIRDGRHPVVELMIDEPFIPNDTYIDCQDHQVLILTGPNMAGKSTYMRQVALTVILAQIGSFVPASSARIGLVDRVFTRVGAYDDLTRGQSTFMVEMVELANILTHATARSLIILDEIGRGTSTYDGLGIAWAVVEYIHHRQRIGAKTIFATHYHHLNELSNVLERVRNYHIAIKEEPNSIVFLYKVVPGGTDKSYGVEVARLAGLPEPVVERAKAVLKRIEEEYLIETRPEQIEKRGPPSYKQLQFLKLPGELPGSGSGTDPGSGSVGATAPHETQQQEPEPQEAPEPQEPQEPQEQKQEQEPPKPHPVLEALRELDVMHMTPVDALNRLLELQQQLDDRERP